jgi:phage nucleotide-binding protein
MAPTATNQTPVTPVAPATPANGSSSSVLRAIGTCPIIKPAVSRQYLKFLIYGYPGIGKTVFCATAQKDARAKDALLIDFEGGTLSIADSDIDVVRVTDFKQFNDVYEFLHSESTKANPRYRTVILDSMTEIQKLNMASVIGSAMISNPNKDPDRPLIDDWGKSQEQMRKLIRAFRDLKMHVFVTALAQEIKDERDGSITVKPSLPGKLADEVCGMLDIVGYLGMLEKTVEGQRVLVRQMLVQPMGKFIAKDRSDRLGQIVENPTVTSVLDKVLPGSTR